MNRRFQFVFNTQMHVYVNSKSHSSLIFCICLAQRFNRNQNRLLINVIKSRVREREIEEWNAKYEKNVTPMNERT